MDSGGEWVSQESSLPPCNYLPTAATLLIYEQLSDGRYASLSLVSLQELYRKIESQARVVGACIRSAEKEINERQKLQQQQQEGELNDAEQNLHSIESNSSSQHQKRSAASSGCSLKGLEKRYHLLYLKAFEIQCMLESLLNKKEKQVSDL